MENLEHDFKFMPKTVKNWKKYLNEEPSLGLFVSVVQAFIEELSGFEKVNIYFLFEELVHWIKFSINNRAKELDFLLKAFQFCIKKEVYSFEKLEVALQVLSKSLLNPDIATTLTPGQSLRIFQSLVKTLKNRKISSFFQNSEEIIENSIISVTSLALFHAEDFTNYELIRMIEKVVRSESIKTRMGQKACLGILQFLNKYIFQRVGKRMEKERIGREGSHFLEFFDNKDLFFVCEILKFFLYERCDLYEIGLSPIYCQLISLENQEINLKIMKSLVKQLKKGEEKVSFEIKKTLMKIAVFEKENSIVFKKIMKKCFKMKWFDEDFNEKLKSEFKIIILDCHKLHYKTELFKLVVPWLSENISLDELKLMLKQSNINKTLFTVFLKCMKDSVKNSKILQSYYQVLPGSGIRISFVDFNFLKFQKISIWLKIYQSSIYEDSCFRLNFDKSIDISVNFSKNRLRITVTSSRMSITLINSIFPLPLKSWNSLGILFLSNISQMVIIINKKSFEFSDRIFSSFREISSLKIDGKLRIRHLKLFSSKIFEESVENEKNSLIFNFSPNKAIFSLTDFEFSSSCKLKTKVKTSEVLCKNPFFNFFLPLLKKYPDITNFVLFFELLSELSTCEKFFQVFNDQFIFLLREILIEKVKNPTMELLDSCENLLISLKETQVYSKVVHSLYLSSQIWTGLDDESFQFYLEAVKSHLIRDNFCKLLGKISPFFVNLGLSSRQSSKKLVFYYFFLTFSVVLKKLENGKVKVLIEVLEAAEELKEFNFDEEFLGFLDMVASEDWRMEIQELFELVGILTSSQFKGKVKTKMFWTALKLVNDFFFTQIFSSPEKNQLFFISKVKKYFQRTVSPLIYPDQLEALLSFFLSFQVKSSKLSLLTSLITDSLSNTLSVDPLLFDQNLELFISSLNTSPTLCEVIIFQSDFPCWLFNLYNCDNPSLYLPFLLLVLFSHLRLFKNFNHQRILLFELISLKKFKEIFDFLSNFLKIVSQKVRLENYSKKYLLEFFNLSEDLLIRIEYKSIPKKSFVEFAELCVNHSSFFQFSRNFIGLAGFSSFSVFEKVKIKELEEVIYIRDGGLVRQLVFIALTGISILPNLKLESFLIEVVEKEHLKNAGNEKAFKESRIEWVGIFLDENVKRVKVSENCGNCLNLMALHIFHEWAFVIRKYEETGVCSEEILRSTANLMFFVKEFGIENKIFQESQNLTSLKVYKSFEKIKNDHLNQMSPIYLPSSSTDFEILLRKKYESDSFIYNDLNTTSKQEDFLKKIKNFQVSLGKCQKTKDFLILLQKYWKNIEVQSFFIVLTSLKLTLLSSFYFTKPPEHSHFYLQDFFSQSESISESTKSLKTSENLKDYNFLNEFWKIDNEFLEFCGSFLEKSEKSFDMMSESSRFITANQSFSELTLDLTLDHEKNLNFFSIDIDHQDFQKSSEED